MIFLCHQKLIEIRKFQWNNADNGFPFHTIFPFLIYFEAFALDPNHRLFPLSFFPATNQFSWCSNGIFGFIHKIIIHSDSIFFLCRRCCCSAKVTLIYNEGKNIRVDDRYKCFYTVRYKSNLYFFFLCHAFRTFIECSGSRDFPLR